MKDGENQTLTKKERKELRRQEKELQSQQAGRKFGLKRFITWLAVAIFIAGGIWGVVQLAKSSPQAASGDLAAAIGASDWFQGKRDAKTELVEYSDYQCPACTLYYPIVKELIDKNSDKIGFVYRNFPLAQHKNALISAYAAEAAGRQGKFWEMQDKIFTAQTVWAESRDARNIFIQYATDLKLDINRFTADLDSQEIKNKVDADYQSGVKSGVNSTPTFYLNGKKLAPTANFDEFRNTIQQAIDSGQ